MEIIKKANEIKINDELRAGAIVRKVVAINNAELENDKGERIKLSVLQGFMNKHIIKVARWN